MFHVQLVCGRYLSPFCEPSVSVALQTFGSWVTSSQVRGGSEEE